MVSPAKCQPLVQLLDTASGLPSSRPCMVELKAWTAEERAVWESEADFVTSGSLSPLWALVSCCGGV